MKLPATAARMPRNKTQLRCSIKAKEQKALWACLGLLQKLCSTDFIVNQLHKNLKFVEHLSQLYLFSRTACVELKLFG